MFYSVTLRGKPSQHKINYRTVIIVLKFNSVADKIMGKEEEEEKMNALSHGAANSYGNDLENGTFWIHTRDTFL